MTAPFARWQRVTDHILYAVAQEAGGYRVYQRTVTTERWETPADFDPSARTEKGDDWGDPFGLVAVPCYSEGAWKPTDFTGSTAGGAMMALFEAGLHQVRPVSREGQRAFDEAWRLDVMFQAAQRDYHEMLAERY